MSSFGAWILAARPPTLLAAVAPVAVGSACAGAAGQLRLGPALGTLAGALLLQIGANFANDVFDYEKGADTAERLGPLRVVQAGLLTPGAVRRGTLVVFLLATLVGAYLAFEAGPTVIVIGLASIASALAYTGGPYPLGYHGLGELFVFVFFGLVAVGGSAFVHAGTWSPLAIAAGVPLGALASAILVVNNLRDRATDVLAGKRTLAVRFGRRGAMLELAALLAVAYAVPTFLVASGRLGLPGLLPLLTLPLAIAFVRGVARDEGRALNARLVQCARLLLVFGALFAVGIVFGARSGAP